MLEKYRSRAQEFLKYMRDIRLAASRSQGWFRYDEQYRLRQANNSVSSWGIINQEFWLLYIAGQCACESLTISNNAKAFSGNSISAILIRVKSAISSPDAGTGVTKGGSSTGARAPCLNFWEVCICKLGLQCEGA